MIWTFLTNYQFHWKVDLIKGLGSTFRKPVWVYDSTRCLHRDVSLQFPLQTDRLSVSDDSFWFGKQNTFVLFRFISSWAWLHPSHWLVCKHCEGSLPQPRLPLVNIAVCLNYTRDDIKLQGNLTPDWMAGGQVHVAMTNVYACCIPHCSGLVFFDVYSPNIK